MIAIPINAYQEIVDFMAARPSLEEMTNFRFSEAVEDHINEILAANHERRLTDAEAAELDEFDKLEHMMRMIKLTALEKLESQQ
jgi:hypothetical protein